MALLRSSALSGATRVLLTSRAPDPPRPHADGDSGGSCPPRPDCAPTRSAGKGKKMFFGFGDAGEESESASKSLSGTGKPLGF